MRGKSPEKKPDKSASSAASLASSSGQTESPSGASPAAKHFSEIRATPVVTIKWSSTFQSKAKQMLDATTNAQEVEALEHLLPFLSADCFTFPNKTSASTRIQAQESLLDIWLKLLDNVDRVFYTNREMYYDVIYRIMVRYEFDLNHYVGIVNVGDSSTKEKNLFPQLLCSPDQERILFKYKDCLIKTVEYVVKKFEKPFSTFVQKRFALQTFVIVYFRIPVLSGAILDSICPTNPDVPYIPPHAIQLPPVKVDPYDVAPEAEDKEDVPTDTASPIALQRAEHAVKQVQLLIAKERERMLVADEVSKAFFDYNHSFFQWTWVATPEKDVELMKQVQNLKHRFMDPAEEYNFLFVSMFVNFVIQQAHGEILWILIPGFSNMIESVICATAKRGLPDYSTLVERSLQDLSRIPGALNIITEVVIKSTHGNSPAQINVMLNLIDNLFMRGSSPEHNLAAPLPDFFDSTVLLEATSILLDGEHFQVLSKVIWFVYRNANRFEIKTRKNLMELMLNKFFSKLFLHWCTEVRQFFHYLILFRLKRVGVVKPEKGADVSNSFEMDTAGNKGLLSKLLSSKEESKTSGGFSKSKKRTNHTDWPIVPFGMEPTPETCMLITASLTEEDIAADEQMRANVDNFINLIRQQVLGGKQESFPPNLAAYAKQSLREYDDTEKLFYKIQSEYPTSALKSGQTLVPNFAYEIRPNIGLG
eukprot:TRINITY_DN3151_c0_g1_i1.p1 TRINITY_DN3151_c0_g1~~TRINITY_DN3151_c0_g1_i1.p1  ORF type:complete len:704 (-),score=170.25 TRINITY_DN3151_c0_g1_i1:151-2262(-)